MKTALPANAKIAKDAKEAIQECVSEFISFITSEASDRCLQEKRKTINGDDLLWAMTTLGFDRYIEPLKIYLSKYRDAVKSDRPEKKVPGGGVKKPGDGDSPVMSYKPAPENGAYMPRTMLPPSFPTGNMGGAPIVSSAPVLPNSANTTVAMQPMSTISVPIGSDLGMDRKRELDSSSPLDPNKKPKS